MKKFSLVTATLLVFATTPSAFAAGYGAAGCGLGSLVFGDQTGPVQILAGTTNGTAGSQTFGITSGTSNCGGSLLTSANERLTPFVVANLDNLAKDIASGSGESMETLVELLNVPASDRDQTYARLQANFSTIFPSPQVEATAVIEQIAKVLSL